MHTFGIAVALAANLAGEPMSAQSTRPADVPGPVVLTVYSDYV
jgi:hypothetical protein